MLRLLAALALLAPLPAVAQSTQADSVTPLASPSVGGSWIVSTRAINSYRLSLTSGASAGYFMVFNSATVPADGAVTPVFCRAVAANSSISMVFPGSPSRFSTGLVLVFSTTGCFSKTISNTAFFEASVK